METKTAKAQSHTHSQFASAKVRPKIAKEYVLPTPTFELNNKQRKTKLNGKSTMHNNV